MLGRTCDTCNDAFHGLSESNVDGCQGGYIALKSHVLVFFYQFIFLKTFAELAVKCILCTVVQGSHACTGEMEQVTATRA